MISGFLAAETSSRSGEVGDVLVMSRYLLMAQAIEAALHRRDLRSRLVPWGTKLDDLGGVDASAMANAVVLLLDELDTRAAIELVGRVIERSPAKVVVLTGRAPGPAWGGVLAAGAAAVSHSATSLDQVEALLKSVVAGAPVQSDELRTELEQQWHSWLAEEETLRTRVARLSQREATVLGLLADGQRVTEIGVRLGVSEATVRSQVKSVRRKLQVDSQLGAVAIARRLSGKIPDAGLSIPAPRRSEE